MAIFGFIMNDNAITKSFIVPNKLGLHARVAARISKMLAGVDSTVFINYNGIDVNGKSILELMSLGAEQGSELTFKISGSDADEILSSLDDLFQNNLGDED